MRDQLSSSVRPSHIFARPENDIATACIRSRPYRARRVCSFSIGMHTHVAEVMSKGRLVAYAVSVNVGMGGALFSAPAPIPIASPSN